jgi:D-glycero-D-manno-heptose 1,7-bisphosphate phosphatase
VSVAAVFVDRDGVINALVTDPLSGRPESPLKVADVDLLEGVGAALRRLREAGFLLVGVTNQPAAAKGRASRAELEAVQSRVLQLLAQEGVRFDAFRICLHHPDGRDPELGVSCDCRKPAPGMLLDAARELDIDLAASWIVGDTDVDVLAGRAAGVRTILVEHPGSAHKRGRATPQLVATDLASAAGAILDTSSR